MRITGSHLVAAVLAISLLSSGLPLFNIGSPTTDAQQPATPPPAERTHSGLLALYDFRSTSGEWVKDRCNVGKLLDLRIDNTSAVRRSPGALEVHGKTRIRSDKPATKIIQAVRRSGEITVELWIRPASLKQDGPARIATLSKNTSERNFTLGQDGNRYDARLRTTKTSRNGMPSLATSAGSLKAELTHVVYTHDRNGRTRIFINGRQAVERSVPGATENWDGDFHLALANEQTQDRPWLGTYHLMAVYGRCLAADEAAQNFNAGCAADAVQELLAKARLARSSELFEKSVAPLLVQRCFECHDAANKRGELDLSRKISALAGGESGKAIVPGKSADSLLWQHVATGEMPQKRPPISREDKQRLREWIDAGAVWTVDVIDPVIYEHDRRAAEIWVQRLTLPEYIETVRSSVDVEIAKEAREMLPPDLRADGFSNTAYNLNVDLKHVQAYARLARIIVERMDCTAFASRFTKSRELKKDNMRRLISSMGKWLLRGPLVEDEIDALLNISSTVATTGGKFDEAVGYLLEAMLQSPRFIYRIETQRGDGRAKQAGSFELASRLSYILWGGPPDQELMRAADRGELSNRSKIDAQVERMLEDPRAITRSTQFLSEWLDLNRLDNLKPDPKRYPKWDPHLAGDMRRETLAFFIEVAWKQKRPLSDLFNAQITFATPQLARHYGLRNPAASDTTGLSRYDLSDVPGRGGLLTQGSTLTMGGDEASMVARGLFVLRDVLRGSVKDPPPCVDTTPVPTRTGLSQRAIAEARIGNRACGGCHAKFEPLAFGLEKFDGLGGYHEEDEHKNHLREDGEILFPGGEKPVAYETSAELMDLLAVSGRVRQTITWKVAQFSLGRPVTMADSPILAKIHESAWRRGGSYKSLIKEFVMSDLIQKTRGVSD